ncbi:unnamed protein product [Trichobilharzia regenti]|nr:unnamed protein product [Trichobilharzia regenti]
MIPLIDLCAPRTLLSTLRLAKQNANTQSNDGINHSQIMNTESEVNQLPSSNSQSTTTTTTIHQQECLLPIVLDLANEITKCVLLKPLQCSNAASNYVLKDSRVMKSTEDSSNTITTTTNNNNLVNMFKSCDLAYQSSSNSFTSCLIGDEDTEISSTTTNLSVGINDGGLGIKSCSKRQHYRYIGYLIGWTEQSTELAEAFITVMQKLAGHHYPAIAAASGVASTAPASSTYNHDVCMTKSTGVGDSQTTENQPDSSSIINMKEEIIVNSNHIDLDMTSQSICGENRMKEHASENACIEWYRLISMNLLSILQHNHDKETEVGYFLCIALFFNKICFVFYIWTSVRGLVPQSDPQCGAAASEANFLWLLVTNIVSHTMGTIGLE